MILYGKQTALVKVRISFEKSLDIEANLYWKCFMYIHHPLMFELNEPFNSKGKRRIIS